MSRAQVGENKPAIFARNRRLRKPGANLSSLDRNGWHHTSAAVGYNTHNLASLLAQRRRCKQATQSNQNIEPPPESHIDLLFENRAPQCCCLVSLIEGFLEYLARA
jgi:hypothetical protein